MPRLRQTEAQKRRMAYEEAVARGMAHNGYKHDRDVAAALGLSKPGYSNFKATVLDRSTTQLFFHQMRLLGVTGRELCRIAGIPFGGDPE